MVQFEDLKEGWVRFSRIPCVTGCIDVWLIVLIIQIMKLNHNGT